ncbi:ANL family adenylate-forming protein [Anoxynatronum buryatiense]|uniref:Acyl-CoA synthetase (AMP-forming)/AMP-acid ligase II n=1 Tax=Anoxynatronum buryatiense TaxID=489973 RepID=A0AA46AK91_9CLOT|nr:fatty acid--CoA ligase family protein [Anoxynatronum buryatiense]SMP67491.1 Acyl-CoA synthetase (AMP-forming)/AMP-acid ligase II [Anoxynatronum buryatiense]
MELTILKKRWQQQPEHVVLIHDNDAYTHAQLLAMWECWDTKLLKCDLVPGTPVAIESDFGPKAITLMLALMEHHAMIVPLSPHIKNREQLLGIAQASLVFNLSEGEEPSPLNPQSAGHPLYDRLIAQKSPGLVLFTSGSTGEPKGAVHDLERLMAKFLVPRKALRTMTFLLFDHIGGFNTLMHVLFNGGTLVTPTERTPESVCHLIEAHRVELLPTSPTFLNLLLVSRAYESHDLTSLKMITYGTEPMPESTLQRLHQILPPVTLKQTYGLSELGIMRTKSKSNDSLWVKIGGEDYQTKIVDGKLWIKAESAMLGYLNAPSPFDEAGWFNTQDRVEVEGEYVRFLGRDSEIINVGGEKVYPAEVESILLEVEGVKDAWVYGVSNPLTGQVVAATVAVGGEHHHREFIKQLKTHCRQRLAKFKCPVKIELTENTFENQRFKRNRSQRDGMVSYEIK